MNLDKFLEHLFSRRVLTVVCILMLTLFCLSACTADDLVSCMLFGVPTCRTMENCSNSISNCQSNCQEKIKQAICDCTCNTLECYSDCADENCYFTDCTSPAECMAGCVKGCFVDENGNETDCGSACGSAEDCDSCFSDSEEGGSGGGGYATDEEFRDWLEKQ